MVLQQLKHYRLLAELGAGGMATVYQAQDTRTGRAVAIKVLDTRLARDPVYLERFRREAATARKLSSPHIVKVLDYGAAGETHFLVMEYVAGVTLQQYLQTHGALPVGQAVDIAAQVSEALVVAHRHGIVHRDIKPQNIMLTADGTAQVTDFGIARVEGAGTITLTGAFIGTLHYVSPEQAQGYRVDIRSDIYSLGVVLYQMLTGVAPFQADTPWVLMHQHVETPPMPVRQLRADVPPAVEALVLRCLAKQPDARYQTPGELLQALRTLPTATQRLPMGVEPGTIAGPVAWQPPARSAANRSLLLGLAGGGAALAIVCVGVLVLALLVGLTAPKPGPTAVSSSTRLAIPTAISTATLASISGGSSVPTSPTRRVVPTPTPRPTNTSSLQPVTTPASPTTRPAAGQAATPAPTPCSRTPGSTFRSLWQQVQTRLGCPLQESTLWTAEQPFEHGAMFWRQDTQMIYVLYLDHLSGYVPGRHRPGKSRLVPAAGAARTALRLWQALARGAGRAHRPPRLGQRRPPGLSRPLAGLRVWRAALVLSVEQVWSLYPLQR